MNSSRTRKYLAGLFSGYTATFVAIAVGLWLTPFMLRFLDREEFAIFALSSDVLMWLNLLDLGITAGLRVQAARLTGVPDSERLNRLASTAFFTQLGVVAAAALAGLAITWLFPTFFPIRPGLQTEAVQMVGLLVLGTLLSLATQPFSALLVAHQQIHIDNLLRLGMIVLRTGVMVILLLMGWKLLALAVASVAATAIMSALAVWRVYHSVPNIHISYRLASRETLRSVVHLGIWFSLGGLAGIVIQSLDRIVAAKIVSLESVTTLVLTGKVYLLAGTLLAQITETARPALGQLLGMEKAKEALEAYRHLFALSSGGAIVVALSLWAGNGSFVPWWVGSQNYGGWPLDLALALNLIVHSWVLPNRATLSAGLIVKPQTLSRVIEGSLHLGLAVWLGLQFGLLGIVISTGIAGIVTSCWYLPWLTARMFQRNFKQFVWNDASRLLLVSVILLATSYFTRPLGFYYNGIVGAALAGSVTFLIGTVLLFTIAFDRSLRVLLLSKIPLPFRPLSEKA